MDFLAGKKTHIVAGLLALMGIVEASTGNQTGWPMIAESANWFLSAAGLSALRIGVAKGPNR